MGALLSSRPDAARLRAVAALASEAAVSAALDAVAADRKWLLERHLELCRIPAPTFQEQRRAEWMLEQFRRLGCEARLDRAGNVLAFPKPSSDGPLIAVTAHLDTVLEPSSAAEVRLGPDGELRGPGVSDNGAGLSALLALARAFELAPVLRRGPLPLVLVANVGEEGEGNLSGMRYLCRANGLANRIHAFVVLDGPSLDHITTRALSSRRFEIQLHGPGGHSWSDHGAANPVHALSRAITLFAESPLHLANGASPRTSFNFGLIEGGTSVNSIPASARAKLDLRSESAARVEELAAALSASIERALQAENERATGGRVSAKVREIGSRPGGALPEDAALLAIIRAVDNHLGIRAASNCASTDANIPLSMGRPAVSIGTGGQGGGTHTMGEWFRPAGRELGLRRLLLVLCLLMREIDPQAVRAN